MAAKIGGIIIDVGADVSKLVNGMTKAQQVADKKTRQIKSAIGVMTGVIAAVGGTATIKGLIDAADMAGETAEALGIAVEKWSEYTYVAKFAGVETNTLKAAFSAMTRRTNNFARSGGGAAKTALEELGISADFARKNFTTADKTFEIIIDRLGKVEDGTRKTAIAQDIFSKSASQVVRYANLGSEEIKRLGDEALRTGNIISKDLADAAGSANETMDLLGTTFTGLGNKLLVKLTPALTRATRAFEELIGVRRQLSTMEIRSELKESIANKISEIDEKKKEIKNAWLDGTENIYKGHLKTMESRLEKLKAELVRFEKFEVNKDYLNLGKSEDKEVINPEWEELKIPKTKVSDAEKQYKKFLDEKKKFLAQFSDDFKRSTLSDYDYEKQHLQKQKEQYQKYGVDKTKLTQWYNSNIKKLDSKQLKNAEKLAKEKLQIQRAFQEAYVHEIQGAFEAEKLKLQEQRDEYLKTAKDKVKVQEWYNSKIKQLSDEETLYLEKKNTEKREQSNNWVYGMEDAVNEYVKNANDNYALSKEYFKTTVDGMSDSLSSFVVEGKSSFSDFARSIGKDLAKIAVQKAMAGIIGNIFGSFSGDSSGSPMTERQSPYAVGGVFDGGYDIAFANGGVVSRATNFPMADGRRGLMGEAGPEAIMPLTRIGKDLGVKGLAPNVQVQVINNGQPLDITKQLTEHKTDERGQQRTIVTLFLDAVHRNAHGAKTGLKAAMQ